MYEIMFFFVNIGHIHRAYTSTTKGNESNIIISFIINAPSIVHCNILDGSENW